MWTLLATAFAGSCAPLDEEALLTHLDQARTAWVEMDVERFDTTTLAITKKLPCLTDELHRHTAASVHRYLGMAAFLQRDEPRARAHFAVSRRVEPAYRFPTNMVPETNPLRSWFDTAESPPVLPVAAPRAGRLQIDGRPSLTLPTTVPSFVQLFDEEGALTWTGVVDDGEGLPTYEPMPEGLKVSGVRYDANVIPLHKPLFVAAGVVGVTGVVLYSLGVSQRSRLFNTKNPPAFAELGRLRSRANTYSTAGLTTLALGGGLAVGAQLSRRF